MTNQRPVPFGKYILLDRVAIGGMAEIFRAKISGAANFEKIIAIKRIHPNMSEDSDFIKMFIDEAKIAGQLSHQNIAQIFELGRIEGHHFIAMEFIWGKDLLQILTKFKQQRAFMNPFQAAFIVSKICEGLDYAHKKKNNAGQPLNIVHRDISPQNILISYDGEIKLIDFGIAKARDRSAHTEAGVLKGKFAYMSPEQVRGLPIDRRSDIFAVGTLLYEMLTSRPLFSGSTDLAVLEKVRNAEVVSPRTINPKIPPTLEAIIMKALSLEVEDRYQWASEMQEELEAFLYSGQPVYTSKRLGTWMKKVFANDFKREKEILKSMLSMIEQQNEPAEDEDDDGETVIMMDDDGRPSMLSAPSKPIDFSEEKTMFLDDDDDEEPDFSEEKTMFLDDDDDEEPDFSEEKTMFLDDDDDDDEVDNPNFSEEKTMFLDDDDDDDDVYPSVQPGINPPLPQRPAPIPTASPAPIQEEYPPVSQELPVPEDIPPQPTSEDKTDQNKKNILIAGISAGVALILGIIIGFVLAPKPSPTPPRTELVIVPQIEQPVLILLDDSEEGTTVKPGDFLKTDIQPGTHKILLKGGGKYKDVREEFEIPENSTVVKVIKPKLQTH